ncbi:MAG: DUF192 domain-containing protein [Actinomycetota bacterium]
MTRLLRRPTPARWSFPIIAAGSLLVGVAVPLLLIEFVIARDQGAGDDVAARVALFDTSGGGVATDPLPVAWTDEQREVGLSGRASLAQDSGMIFLYDEPRTGFFWMKDTLIPLSIAFVAADDRIISIQEMEPCPAEPCTKYAPDTEYVAAIEMNQGWFRKHGVRVGDIVTWDSGPPVD